ncbi:hypothetical protein DFQ27_000251 [Actinomortierella ambigua]|uniref:RRM domain-containing protein n=1 Tax=Actinomortierella ambigua TaxID=1343610 RepID=A0A9P6QDE0_9FUNG|nr:hypothetical protein DFQ27_000251 [Actinomortierella ambigua]
MPSLDWPTFTEQQVASQAEQSITDGSNGSAGIMMELEWRDRRLGTGMPYEDAKGVELSKLPTGSRLSLDNLPRCSKNDIFELFGRHGKVVEIVLNNGYGYVQYERVQDCKRALAAEQGGMFMGNRLATLKMIIVQRSAMINMTPRAETVHLAQETIVSIETIVETI